MPSPFATTQAVQKKLKAAGKRSATLLQSTRCLCGGVMGDARAHVFVSGKVQGVNYRNNTVKQARSLGLGGWVRNLTDGRVELVAEGPKADVEVLLQWCHRGPRRASVEEVAATWEDPKGVEQGFRKIADA
eukprot:TRINITY_DN16964_c0_g1_i1.p1 TRINITY_DN16964_c0_g1~~TRINITY_DN16964_c0_g1_i1.p1  ORF type:complete len:131 (+),score=28.64 TRINITY_DN16964_c0_g1_i1:22-414(+)